MFFFPKLRSPGKSHFQHINWPLKFSVTRRQKCYKWSWLKKTDHELARDSEALKRYYLGSWTNIVNQHSLKLKVNERGKCHIGVLVFNDWPYAYWWVNFHAAVLYPWVFNPQQSKAKKDGNCGLRNTRL